MGHAKAPFKPVEAPAEWPAHYSEEAQQLCCDLISWMNTNQQRMSWLAKLCRVNNGTLYNAIKGRYNTDPMPHLKKALDATRVQDQRTSIRDIPFVETTVSKIAFACCERARRYRTFAVLSGFVGTGKTRSLKEYQARNANTLMIEANPGMSVTALLLNLVKILGCSVKASANQDAKFEAILDELQGTGSLLIIDEAETLTPKALHYLRRIRDKAGVGIVLAGTEGLNALIKPEHGEFDQIRSRVNFWPKCAQGIKREDADAIISTAFADLGELDDSIADRLWQYCGGSMRLLVEDLIPAIRDYGLAQHDTLTVQLIDAVATQALSLAKPD